MLRLPNHRYLTSLLVLMLMLLTIYLVFLPKFFLSASTVTHARHLSSKSSPSNFTLPPEYRSSYPSDPNPICEANHGLPYLTHIAQNHISMCDEDYSKSGFECFKTIHQDLICVGQNIQYTRDRPPSSSDEIGRAHV